MPSLSRIRSVSMKLEKSCVIRTSAVGSQVPERTLLVFRVEQGVTQEAIAVFQARDNSDVNAVVTSDT